MKTPNAPFAEAVSDASAGSRRVPQSDFRAAGALAIVDQGKSIIAGYTDDLDAAVRVDEPVIVFGDHTRAVKYVDFPFAMGADGVKVLRAKEGFDPRFVFRFLQFTPVPNVGYSRHFKLLKEIAVPKPPLDEQRRIAAILDQADALRAKHRQVLAHLDTLTQSVFRSTLADTAPVLVSASELMPSMRNGVSPAVAGTHEAEVLTLSAVTRGSFNPTAVKTALFAVRPPKEKRVSSADFLICRGNGNKSLVGAATFSREDRPDLVFPDTIIAGRVDTTKVTLTFLEAAWRQRSVRRQIETAARTTNGTFKVNQELLSKVRVPTPRMSIQREFARRSDATRAESARLERSLTALDELFASLQYRAFRGEL